jgi:hypothetical protein
VLGGLDLPPILDASQLRPRSSNPPANEEEGREPLDEQALLPSIPPDAIVPAATSNEEFAVAPPVPADAGASQVEEAFQLTSEKRLVAREASPVPARDGSRAGDVNGPRGPVGRPREQRVDRPEGRVEIREREEARAPRDAGAVAPAIVSLPPEDLQEVPDQPRARAVPAAEPSAASSSPWGFVVAFALLAGAVVAVLRMTGHDLEPQWPSTGPAPSVSAGSTATPNAAVPVVPSAAPSATVATTPSAGTRPPSTAAGSTASASAAAPPSAATSSAASSGGTADDALPPGAAIPAGYGMLQIGAPRGARVLVDGIDAGIGPLSSTVQRAGYHQVRVEQDGKRTQYVIEVRAGKTTRVKSSPLP